MERELLHLERSILGWGQSRFRICHFGFKYWGLGKRGCEILELGPQGSWDWNLELWICNFESWGGGDPDYDRNSEFETSGSGDAHFLISDPDPGISTNR